MAFDQNQLPEWNAPGVEPPQSKKDSGWGPGEKPPSDWFNWFFSKTYNALKTLFANAQHKEEKGKPGGYAALDENGKVMNADGTYPGGVSEEDFAAHSADTAAHGIGDKSALLTSNKSTLVAAINELFTFANDGKSSIAAVIGSPATSGDTFATLANHITNHKSSLANSLGSGSSADSLQTLVSTRLQELKNTLATNLTNKGQTANGSETLLSLINKVANVNTGKKWASGTFTSSSGTTYTVSGLAFKPSIVLVYVNSINTGRWMISLIQSVTPSYYVYPSGSGKAVSNIAIYQTNSTSNPSTTYDLSNSSQNKINNDGFTVHIYGDGSSNNYGWIAIE